MRGPAAEVGGVRDGRELPEPNMADYERYRREFRWAVPEHFNFAGDVVDRWARDPSRLALIWEDAEGDQVRLRFSELAAAINRCGNALLGLGLARGDRVIVHLPRIPQWFVATLACVKVGAIPIPTTEMMQASDLKFRARHSGATCVFTTPEGTERFDEIADSCPELTRRLVVDVLGRPEYERRPGWLSYQRLCEQASPALEAAVVGAEDPAIMYYTSGTTGQPKAVVHASRALYAWRQAAFCWLDIKPGDLHWCTADTGWSKFGTSMVFGPWSWGAALLMYHGPFDPEQRLHFIQKHRPSTFCAAPTEFRLIVQCNLDAWDLSSVRHSVSAGEPLNPEVIERWRRSTGLEVYDGYGLTEALMACHNYRCLPIRPGSMGKPLPGYEMAVLDEEGRELGPDQEGDLVIGSDNPCLMIGNWGDSGALERSNHTRWFVTGDRAWVDSDGYYWFVGRGDDVILSAGYRIGPFEVESALASHPAVAESAAVGSPDPIRGEVVKAFVVLLPGQQASPRLAAELQEHVKRVTAPYKYPRRVEFVDELPKTITGKIRRRELKLREQRASTTR